MAKFDRFQFKKEKNGFKTRNGIINFSIDSIISDTKKSLCNINSQLKKFENKISPRFINKQNKICYVSSVNTTQIQIHDSQRFTSKVHEISDGEFDSKTFRETKSAEDIKNNNKLSGINMFTGRSNSLYSINNFNPKVNIPSLPLLSSSINVPSSLNYQSKILDKSLGDDCKTPRIITSHFQPLTESHITIPYYPIYSNPLPPYYTSSSNSGTSNELPLNFEKSIINNIAMNEKSNPNQNIFNNNYSYMMPGPWQAYLPITGLVSSALNFHGPHFSTYDLKCPDAWQKLWKNYSDQLTRTVCPVIFNKHNLKTESTLSKEENKEKIKKLPVFKESFKSEGRNPMDLKSISNSMECKKPSIIPKDHTATTFPRITIHTSASSTILEMSPQKKKKIMTDTYFPFINTSKHKLNTTCSKEVPPFKRVKYSSSEISAADKPKCFLNYDSSHHHQKQNTHQRKSHKGEDREPSDAWGDQSNSEIYSENENNEMDETSSERLEYLRNKYFAAYGNTFNREFIYIK
ncbi:unnamed protein product [Gordionus sp. m RMFG-2023]